MTYLRFEIKDGDNGKEIKDVGYAEVQLDKIVGANKQSYEAPIKIDKLGLKQHGSITIKADKVKKAEEQIIRHEHVVIIIKENEEEKKLA